MKDRKFLKIENLVDSPLLSEDEREELNYLIELHCSINTSQNQINQLLYKIKEIEDEIAMKAFFANL